MHGPIVRLVNGTQIEGGWLPDRHTEDLMIGRGSVGRDPFEGKGAYRRQIRIRVESAIALALAIGACGITLAMWLRTLQPLFERVLFR